MKLTELAFHRCYQINMFIAGIDKLLGVYKDRPSFADAEAQEDVKQRLSQVIICYLPYTNGICERVTEESSINI